MSSDDSHGTDDLHAALHGAEVSIGYRVTVQPPFADPIDTAIVGVATRIPGTPVDVRIVGLPTCTVHPEVTKDGVVLHVRHELHALLAAVISIVERECGYLRHEDQEVLRHARAALDGDLNIRGKL